MKIALIYTAKTDGLKSSLEKSVRKICGSDTEISEYQDLTALQETVKNGFITKSAGSRYGALCVKAAEEGADAILSTCCVMGDAVEPLKGFLLYLGVPLCSVDETFCKQALLENKKICVIATAAVAAFSVGHTIERQERILGLHREKRTVIAQGTAGLADDAFAEKLMESAGADADPAECIILSQPSMAFAGAYIGKHTGKKVYTAIDNPAAEIYELIKSKSEQ